MLYAPRCVICGRRPRKCPHRLRDFFGWKDDDMNEPFDPTPHRFVGNDSRGVCQRCGLPGSSSIHQPVAPDRRQMSDIPTSFIVETNKGGMPVTICSCGVLMFKPMASIHIEVCNTAQLALAKQRPLPES